MSKDSIWTRSVVVLIVAGSIAAAVFVVIVEKLPLWFLPLGILFIGGAAALRHYLSEQ